MNRSDFCEHVRSIVTGRREQDHGNPEDNFQRIAEFWELTLKDLLKDKTRIEPWRVALMLSQVKTARILNSPTLIDSWVDLAGYSACGCELVTQPRRRAEDLNLGVTVREALKGAEPAPTSPTSLKKETKG